MTETQQRFLRAIAERVPSEQVVELHLFPPIRQGGVETGVAVVAEDPRRAPVAQADGTSDGEQVEVQAEPTSEAPPQSGAEGESELELTSEDEPTMDLEMIDGAAPVSRLTIHTARYRLTLKGVDRGKWEVDVVAEADAPLDAVDAVVRGVQRRAGEGTEPDRLSNEAFRDALETPLAQLER